MEDVKLFAEGEIVHLLDSCQDKEWIEENGFDYCTWDDDAIERHAGEECVIIGCVQTQREMEMHGGAYDVRFGDMTELRVFGYDIAEFYDGFNVSTIEETDLLGLLGGV